MFGLAKREHHQTAPSPLRLGGPGVWRNRAAGARQGPYAISLRSFQRFLKPRGGGANRPGAHRHGEDKIMRKLLTLTAAAAFVAAFGFAAGPASAQKIQNCDNSGTGAFGCNIIKGPELQSDHALFGAPPDTAIYCGVKLDNFVLRCTLLFSDSGT